MIPETIPFIPEPFRRHRIFCVPSGIGDFAWIYAKLTNYGEPFVTVHSDDLLKDRVNRALPFVQLLPKVAYATTGHFLSLTTDEAMRGWDGQRLPKPNPSYFTLNPWLESGQKLDDALPSIPTTRHFEMRRPPEAEVEADLFVKKGEPAVAIYTANFAYFGQGSYRPDQWGHVAELLAELFAGAKIVFLGAPYDFDLLWRSYQNAREREIPNLVFVHDRSFPTALEILRRCQLFVGAVSGLTIIAEYQRVPTLHLYPAHFRRNVRLMGTWESPEMQAKGLSRSVFFSYLDELAGALREVRESVVRDGEAASAAPP